MKEKQKSNPYPEREDSPFMFLFMVLALFFYAAFLNPVGQLLKKGKTFFFFLAVLVLAGTGISGKEVKAAQTDDAEYYTKVVTFTAENEQENIPVFEKTVEKDGVLYTLSDTKIETIKKTPRKEIVTYQKDEEVILPEGETFDPEEEKIEDGIIYKLVSTDSETADTVQSYEKSVTGYTDYDYPVAQADVPAIKVVRTTDDQGNTVDVACSLTGITENGGGWQQNTISITFYNLGAEEYVWNGITVSGSQEVPLSGYEEQLLQSVGADSSSRVLDTYWVSDPYVNEDGQLCRDAQADIEEYVGYYRANYAGQLKTDVQGIRYLAHYEGTKEVDSSTSYTFERQATARYEKVKESQIPEIVKYILSGAGILILILLVILILYVVAKKQKKERKVSFKGEKE